MRVLVVTNMYPTNAQPSFGVFVADQVDALRQAGVSVDVFFINGKASTWNYMAAFSRLWHHLRTHEYDLVHAHYLLAGIVARAQLKYPVVLTHHGSEVLGHPRWQTTLAHVVTPLFDEVIYVSEECRRALPHRSAWVIPCGIDLDVFKPITRTAARERLHLPLDRPLVLWAGELKRPEKRFWLVEATMREVKSRMPSAQLVLLTGKPHAVVPTYMSACDALVLTSVAEGSPMVVKEAMACNLPIVSVRVGDVAEVIGGTRGCTLVADNPAAIAQGLLHMLQRPERSDGRTHVERFRHDAIAQRIVEVYTRALRRGRRVEVYASS